MPFANGYTYRRKITIDHTKVSASDQSNFPVLITGTLTYLKTVGNGGNVQNSSGFDVVFTSDLAGSSLLAWETAVYTATSGLVEYWVNIPTLSHTADTVIYLFYGNSSIVSDQSNKGSTWDSNFKGIWHFPNGSSLSAADSSTINATPTINGTVTATSGQVDGGALFDGTTGDIQVPDNAAYHITQATSFTLEGWFKQTANGQPQDLFRYDSGSGVLWCLRTQNPSCLLFGDRGGTLGSLGMSFTPTDGTWYHIAAVRDVANTQLRIYINGALDSSGSDASTGTWTATGNPLHLGSFKDTDEFFNGTLDELRLSNTIRSADWITTEYNNQFSPGSFYTIESPMTAFQPAWGASANRLIGR